MPLPSSSLWKPAPPPPFPKPSAGRHVLSERNTNTLTNEVLKKGGSGSTVEKLKKDATAGAGGGDASKRVSIVDLVSDSDAEGGGNAGGEEEERVARAVAGSFPFLCLLLICALAGTHFSFFHSIS